MPLAPSDEQRQFADTAREFLREHAPVAALRRLRDTRDPLGYSMDLWSRMAELGWAGITIPEQYGGLDFGFAGVGLLMEECGRTLAASPLFTTCVLGAGALQLGGNDAQKEEFLPLIATGELRLALALEESHRHDPAGVAMSAARTARGWRLNGRKQFVADGNSAERLVVVARTGGVAGDEQGLSLFLVDAGAPGLARQRLTLMDSRNAASMEFRDVEVDAGALLGEADNAWPVLQQVLDRGRSALAAEMLGGAEECFERTVAYLKTREQFGAVIGTFQALQHRAAQMFAELELFRSATRAACDAVDSNAAMLPMLASLAKARANDGAELITNEAVQLHGGIGTTDELDVGLFLKRSRVCMQLLGDSAFHRNRYATLRGF